MVKRKIKQILMHLGCWTYKLTIPSKVKRIRGKDKISVLFILNDVAKWKSEKLYLEMLQHPRFNPILGVTIRPGESDNTILQKKAILKEYLQYKGYDYIDLSTSNLRRPDIVIYSEPYGNSVPKDQSIYKYLSSLFLSINYSCHTTHLHIDYYSLLHRWCWIDCYENQRAIEQAYKSIGHIRKSIQLTGLPMIDQLLEPPTENPWKAQDYPKKRIIWAPHHSLGGFEGESIVYSTFLTYAETMIELAKKYQENIQIAFKPHPLLFDKLIQVWGREATEEYYKKWEEMKNTQLELGSYKDLFATSDAMIHDSSSFIVEYLLMDKPTLFLVRDLDDIRNDLNDFGDQAFLTQNLGYNIKDIETFITQVIKGKDINSYHRGEFLKKEIVGYPEGDASKKIIDTILGIR